MKTMLAILSSFITSAQAHESAVPHTHPHDVSMLPGIDLVVCGLLALAERRFGPVQQSLHPGGILAAEEDRAN